MIAGVTRRVSGRSTPRPITRLLVANRGEIACRVVRTARVMGIGTVAVHSDPDAGSPHVRLADLAVRLPGQAPTDTYLHIERLVDAAIRTGADAVHPGYGFLSESPAFARAVEDAGLVWVGPSPDAMEAMASKIGAKAIMRDAGVPTLPSVVVGDDPDALPRAAALDGLGWPLLVKASAGGGGRGMRLVRDPSELPDAIAAARREALAAFGDGTVFLERFVTAPRHVEVQVIADTHGQVVTLFERDCSVQRRHQKIVEESPSPVVGPALRAQLCEHAAAAARAVGYRNAGTVEFVVETVGTGETGGTGETRRTGEPGEPADPAETLGAYFLEMNTRLQVEHPVTEAVTGLDLVRLQLLVAEGRPLPAEVAAAAEAGPQGHAVEARLYAEDPARGWLPQTGRLHRFELGADRPGLRVEAGVESGSVVSSYYDPMLAKVIAHAPTREEATAALSAALAGARIHGPVTNRDLLVRVLRHPEFAAGRADTGFLDRVGLDGPGRLAEPLADDAAVVRHAVAAAFALRAGRRASARVQRTIPAGFRNNPSQLETTTFDSGSRSVTVGYGWPEPGASRARHAAAVVEVDGVDLPLDALDVEPDLVHLTTDGVRRAYRVDQVGELVFVDGPDGSTALRRRPRFPEPGQQRVEGSALAPMPGGVVRVAVLPGDRVEQGDVVVVLEAMKMEHAVHSPVSGTVVEIDVEVGDQVESGRLLAVVKPDDPEPASEAGSHPPSGASPDGVGEAAPRQAEPGPARG